MFCLVLIRVNQLSAANIIDSKKFIHDEFHHTTIGFAITKLLKLIVVVLTILIILQSLGFNISAILALAYAGGLVVGFAAKIYLLIFLVV